MKETINPLADALRNKAAELMQARLSVPLCFMPYEDRLSKLCDEAINTVELLEHSIELAHLWHRPDSIP